MKKWFRIRLDQYKEQQDLEQEKQDDSPIFFIFMDNLMEKSAYFVIYNDSHYEGIREIDAAKVG